MGTKNNPGKFDCYEKADPDEPMFVLLGRDPLASVLVQFWADWNVSLRQSYDKTQEANACARAMAEWAEKLGKNVPWRSDLIADLRALLRGRVASMASPRCTRIIAEPAAVD